MAGDDIGLQSSCLCMFPKKMDIVVWPIQLFVLPFVSAMLPFMIIMMPFDYCKVACPMNYPHVASNPTKTIVPD